MANYANKYFEEYVPEDSLEEAILCQNPVSNNLDNVKKLDEFLRDTLKEKRKTNEQNIKNVLEKLVEAYVEVMEYSRERKTGRRRCCPNIYR